MANKSHQLQNPSPNPHDPSQPLPTGSRMDFLQSFMDQPLPTPPKDASVRKSLIIPFFGSDNLIISQQREFHEQEFGCVEDMLDTLELKIYEKNYSEASSLISRIKKMILEGDRYIYRVKNYRKYEELQRCFVGFVTEQIF
jgi:hypothetical protein